MTPSEPTLPAADPVEEELVAYLDGELEDAARQRVERRLADDAEYRGRLTRMQKTWDMLDVLEKTEPDDGFVHTTVEMIALKTKEDEEGRKSAVVRSTRITWLAAGVASLVSAVAGYFLLMNVLEAPDRKLVRDLPVIERVDEYRLVDDLEFLQQLEKEGLFVMETDHVP